MTATMSHPLPRMTVEYRLPGRTGRINPLTGRRLVDAETIELPATRADCRAPADPADRIGRRVGVPAADVEILSVTPDTTVRLWETGDTDRRRWQLRDAQKLVEILKLGQRQKLPPVPWSVTGHLLLAKIPDANAWADETVEGQRAAWEAWADALTGLAETEWSKVPPEHHADGGIAKRSEAATSQGTRLRCEVVLRGAAEGTSKVIILTLLPVEDAEGGDPR